MEWWWWWMLIKRIVHKFLLEVTFESLQFGGHFTYFVNFRFFVLLSCRFDSSIDDSGKFEIVFWFFPIFVLFLKALFCLSVQKCRKNWPGIQIWFPLSDERLQQMHNEPNSNSIGSTTLHICSRFHKQKPKTRATFHCFVPTTYYFLLMIHDLFIWINQEAAK